MYPRGALYDGTRDCSNSLVSVKPAARISSSVMTSTGTACSSTFLAKREPRTDTALPATALDANEKLAVAAPSTLTETLADSYPMYEAVTV